MEGDPASQFTQGLALDQNSCHRTHYRTPGSVLSVSTLQGMGLSGTRERLPHGLGASHLARFSVTLLKASCFLARFLAAASLAIFSPSRSLRPGSKIYEVGVSVACTGPSLSQALPCCWGKCASSHGPYDP